MEREKTLNALNSTSKNTMMEWLDIEYTDFTGDTLTAEMPVNEKVHQPYGLLHGGASAALAETVGSYLSALQFDRKTHGAVGTNLNIYHLKSARKGKIIAKAHFIRKGSSLHVIQIDITDENHHAISHATLTTKIILKSKKYAS